MSFVLNDASLEGHFTSVDDFEDSLAENIIPLLEKISYFVKKSNKDLVIIYKSIKMYERIVSEGKSMHNIIAQTNNPIFTKFKRVLLDTCFEEPFFEESSKSDASSRYYRDKDIDTGEVPNCFSEAFEGDFNIISFEHNQFMNDTIVVKKVSSDKSKSICNFRNLENSKDYFIDKFNISLVEYLKFLNCAKKHEFFKESNEISYSSDNEFHSNKLSKDNIKSIGKNFITFQELVKMRGSTGHFTDNITHKGKKYLEFRCSMDKSREFRIYFIMDGDKHVYLNSYVKDQAKPPDFVKNKTVDLIKLYEERSK